MNDLRNVVARSARGAWCAQTSQPTSMRVHVRKPFAAEEGTP